MGRASEPKALAAGSRGGELLNGDVVDGRYRVTQRLGEGGMGEVYEVEHSRLKRPFALKLLRAELAADSELVARFDREARAVATLHSDHVVSIVDSGTLSDGRPYFVMERLLGQDLKQVLAENERLPVGRAVSMAIDICLGLHAAHSAGLVHRDLKPENVFVTLGDDARERCKLLDFGVVKLTEHDHTRPGALLGTARYMAPEQVAHGSEIGPAADLFALGVVLYRCLAGQHPFAADSLERVLFRVMNDTPPTLGAPVPAELAALVNRALAKAPSERPRSALDFARALARFSPQARTLESVTSFQVGTALCDDPTLSELTSPDSTPALEARASSAPAAPRRSLLLFSAAVLLIVATLGVDRLLNPRVSSPGASSEAALATSVAPAFRLPAPSASPSSTTSVGEPALEASSPLLEPPPRQRAPAICLPRGRPRDPSSPIRRRRWPSRQRASPSPSPAMAAR